MAVLTETERFAVWASLMRRWSRDREETAFLKTDLRAAVDALDGWLDTNAATINAALPQPFRGAATQEQKALLLSYIVLKRYGDKLREE